MHQVLQRVSRIWRGTLLGQPGKAASLVKDELVLMLVDK